MSSKIKNSFDRPLSIALIICLLILPNIHVSVLSNQAVIPREIFFYAASILFVAILYRSASLRYNVIFVVAAIFCFWQFISLLWSSDFGAGIEQSVNFYFYLLAAFALFQLDDDRQKRYLLIALVAGISFSALIGVLQNFGIDLLPIFQASPPSSTFVNKNLAASASLLALPVSLMLLLTSKQSRHKLYFVIAGSLLFSYILIARSKGVWLGGLTILVLATILLILMSKRREIGISFKRDKYYLIAIVAIGVLMFLLPSARFSDSNLVEQYDIWSGSAGIRIGMYKDALDLSTKSPVIGIGEGSFRREFRSEPGGDYVAQHASNGRYVTLLHNDHLQYLVELGLVGILLWVSMLYMIFRYTFGYILGGNYDQGRQLMALALLLGITAMLIHALFSFPIRIISTAGIFWITFGLLLSFQNDASAARTTTIPTRTRHLSAFLYAVLLLLSSYLAFNRAIGSYYLQAAEDVIFERGKCAEAKYNLDKSIQASGLDVRLAHILTLTYDACGHHSLSEMEELMDKVLEYEPNQAKALLIKGKIAFTQGMYERAAAFFQHSLQVNPESKDAVSALRESLKKIRQTN